MLGTWTVSVTSWSSPIHTFGGPPIPAYAWATFDPDVSTTTQLTPSQFGTNFLDLAGSECRSHPFGGYSYSQNVVTLYFSCGLDDGVIINFAGVYPPHFVNGSLDWDATEYTLGFIPQAASHIPEPSILAIFVIALICCVIAFKCTGDQSATTSKD